MSELDYTYEVSMNDGYPVTWSVGKLYADETMEVLDGTFDAPDHAQAHADELAESEGA